jgi:molybdate transport system substrate-binding protein
MRARVVIATTLAVIVACGPATAAEISILVSMATMSGVKDLAAAYERASGHRVVVNVQTGDALVRWVEANSPADLISNFTQVFGDLVKREKVVAGSPMVFARAGVGVAVKSGAPKPDISTADAFRRAMLDAKSIGYSRSGSGQIAARALERVGISDQVKDKVKFVEGTPVAEIVAKGEVEIGMQQINAIVPVAGADYAGPLPGDLQEYLSFSVGLMTVAKEPAAAQEFMRFMAAPENAEHLRKSGMEPAVR